MIQIDKGIPLTPRRNQTGDMHQLPFEQMGIGDSFLMPDTLTLSQKRSSVQRANRLAHGRRRYTLRTTPAGIRVWRAV